MLSAPLPPPPFIRRRPSRPRALGPRSIAHNRPRRSHPSAFSPSTFFPLSSLFLLTPHFLLRSSTLPRSKYRSAPTHPSVPSNDSGQADPRSGRSKIISSILHSSPSRSFSPLIFYSRAGPRLSTWPGLAHSSRLTFQFSVTISWVILLALCSLGRNGFGEFFQNCRKISSLSWRGTIWNRVIGK